MLVQTYFPQQLAPSRYDGYLASGWFRGSVMLYKMDILCLDKDLFSVVNIRLNLQKHSMKKSLRKIERKGDERFTISTGPAQPNPEKELLYLQHKEKFKGFIHPTLSDYLSSGFHQTVFDTREICVYDGDKLIAVSFFDRGERALASLLGLYDPEYKSYSLGIYTMIKELRYGIQNGYKWYYPGYVLDRPSPFDYKLRLGEFEYYNNNRRWSKFENHDPSSTKSYLFRSKLNELAEMLNAKGRKFQEVLYPLFSMGYVGYWNAEFLKYPLFLELSGNKEEKTILSFDLDLNAYVVLKVIPAQNYDHLMNMETSQEFEEQDNYKMKLLMVSEQLCITPDKEGTLIKL